MGVFNLTKSNAAKPEQADTSGADRNSSHEDALSLVERHWRRPPTSLYAELGTIRYVNLTQDGKHGDYEIAVSIAKESGRPIFANFVEWPG